MYKSEETKSETNRQSEAWPLDYNQFQTAQKTFPKSWSVSPVNGLAFQGKVS